MVENTKLSAVECGIIALLYPNKFCVVFNDILCDENITNITYLLTMNELLNIFDEYGYGRRIHNLLLE